MTRAIVVGVLMLVAAVQGGAQRSVLLVGVGDAETGLFVPHAEVRVRGTDLVTRTDSLGQARLARLGAGTFIVEVRRVGYEPLSAPVRLSGRDSLEVVLMVRSSAHRLPTVAVHDTATSMFLREFEERRKTRHVGHFVTGEEIDRIRDYDVTSFLLAKLPGLRITSGGRVMSTRGGCTPLVFWNGVRISGGGIATLFETRDLGGVEYYPPGLIPVQYNTPGDMTKGNPIAGSTPRLSPWGQSGSNGGCGAVLFWARP